MRVLVTLAAQLPNSDTFTYSNVFPALLVERQSFLTTAYVLI